MKCPCGHVEPCVRVKVSGKAMPNLGEVRVFNLSPESLEALHRRQGTAKVALPADVLASVVVVPWP